MKIQKRKKEKVKKRLKSEPGSKGRKIKQDKKKGREMKKTNMQERKKSVKIKGGKNKPW